MVKQTVLWIFQLLETPTKQFYMAKTQQQCMYTWRHANSKQKQHKEAMI